MSNKHHAIGIPTETKPGEMRVALTPTHAHELVLEGLTVHIQAGAGDAAGFLDETYQAAGCILHPTAVSLYTAASLIVKVKEPTAADLKHLTSHHTLFCFLHLAGEPQLTQQLLDLGLTAYAYETLEIEGQTPLLAPMSQIAGRLAVQLGTRFLHTHQGGRGVLLGGLGDGSNSGTVTIIGAGEAGRAAGTLAAGMGANVHMLDLNPNPFKRLPKAKNLITHNTTQHPQTLENLLPETDLLIGAVYLTGQKAPIVVTEADIQNLPKGAVVMDIAIDQGGCIETSQPCTHHAPTFTKHGIVHSAITNLPATVPRTASLALANTTLPHIINLAKNKINKPLKSALNLTNSQLKIQL